MLWRGSDESLPDVNMQANRVECKLIMYYFLRGEGMGNYFKVHIRAAKYIFPM